MTNLVTISILYTGPYYGDEQTGAQMRRQHRQQSAQWAGGYFIETIYTGSILLNGKFLKKKEKYVIIQMDSINAFCGPLITVFHYGDGQIGIKALC